jgi:hypothetical protein
MALKPKKAGGGTKDSPRVGTHMARLVGITDLGHQPGFEWQGKEIPSQWKFEFTYELPNSKMADGRPHWVSEEVKNNDFVGKGIISTLMARVKTMAADNEEAAAKDLSLLLGQPCMVTLSDGNNGYVKMKGQPAVSGIPMGMPVPELVNDTFIFDMDEPDMGLYETFPDFKKEKLSKALNFGETQLARELAADDKF